jgi:hypothetical protein
MKKNNQYEINIENEPAESVTKKKHKKMLIKIQNLFSLILIYFFGWRSINFKKRIIKTYGHKNKSKKNSDRKRKGFIAIALYTLVKIIVNLFISFIIYFLISYLVIKLISKFDLDAINRNDLLTIYGFSITFFGFSLASTSIILSKQKYQIFGKVYKITHFDDKTIGIFNFDYLFSTSLFITAYSILAAPGFTSTEIILVTSIILFQSILLILYIYYFTSHTDTDLISIELINRHIIKEKLNRKLLNSLYLDKKFEKNSNKEEYVFNLYMNMYGDEFFYIYEFLNSISYNLSQNNSSQITDSLSVFKNLILNKSKERKNQYPLIQIWFLSKELKNIQKKLYDSSRYLEVSLIFEINYLIIKSFAFVNAYSKFIKFDTIFLSKINRTPINKSIKKILDKFIYYEKEFNKILTIIDILVLEIIENNYDVDLYNEILKNQNVNDYNLASIRYYFNQNNDIYLKIINMIKISAKAKKRINRSIVNRIFNNLLVK